MSLTLAERTKYPNAKPVCLVEISVPLTLFHWTNDATYTNTWYSSTGSYRIDGAREGGSDLTEKSTLALCNTNNASYYWDHANNRLYINPTAADPRGRAVLYQAIVLLHIANRTGKVFSSIPYRPILLAAPRISRRIPALPGDVGQTPSGKLTFANAGYFDGMTDLDWAAAIITLKAGLDVW